MRDLLSRGKAWLDGANRHLSFFKADSSYADEVCVPIHSATLCVLRHELNSLCISYDETHSIKILLELLKERRELLKLELQLYEITGLIDSWADAHDNCLTIDVSLETVQSTLRLITDYINICVDTH